MAKTPAVKKTQVQTNSVSACDNCRRTHGRRGACDRGSPCSICLSFPELAGTCTYTPQKKRGPKKGSASVSKRTRAPSRRRGRVAKPTTAQAVPSLAPVAEVPSQVAVPEPTLITEPSIKLFNYSESPDTTASTVSFSDESVVTEVAGSEPTSDINITPLFARMFPVAPAADISLGANTETPASLVPASPEIDDDLGLGSLDAMLDGFQGEPLLTGLETPKYADIKSMMAEEGHISLFDFVPSQLA